MKTIKVNINMENDIPVLHSSDDKRYIGTLHNNNALMFEFIRESSLQNYDMSLYFKLGYDGDWIKVDLGKENTYTLTDTFTQSDLLSLQVSFEGEDYRCSSLNSLLFKNSHAPKSGISVADDDTTLTGWTPKSDWPDIQSHVDKSSDFNGNSIENVRYAYVVVDSSNTITLPAGYQYYLSDGAYYDGLEEVTHTWDRTKDIDCSDGYKTRAVIVCSESRDVEITHYGFNYGDVDYPYIPSLYVYLGDCNVTKFDCSNGGGYPNTVIQAITCCDKTTANEDALAESAFSRCKALQCFEFLKGITRIPYNVFEQTSITGMILPKDAELGSALSVFFEMPLSKLVIQSSTASPYLVSDVSALMNLEIPKGFWVNYFYLNACHNLSMTSVENLINNYADTGAMLILSQNTLNQLSDELLALAVSKNLSIAG